MFRKIHNLIGKDDLIKIIIYSLVDILVGIYIGQILSINSPSQNNRTSSDKEENKQSESKNKAKDFISDNYLIEIIYLFNPLSIISCVGMQLRIIYNFLFFGLINYFDIDNETGKNTKFLKNLLTSVFAIINLLCNPASAFIIMFYYFRNFYLATFTQKLKLFITWLLSLGLVAGFLYVAFDVNEFYGVISQYNNYFFLKDSLPNIGLMWGLFPEVWQLINLFLFF